MHRLSTMALTAALALHSYALSPAPAALEPVNWEADADARFEPRVEQVVVDRAQHRAKQDDATDAPLWEGWGLEAMVPLRQILDGPRWEDSFKSRALELMYVCPLEGAEAVLVEELNRRADGVVESAQEATQRYRQHLYAAVTRSPDLLKPLLAHENAEAKYFAAEVLVGRLQQVPPEIATLIDAYAASEDPTARHWALNLLLSVPTQANNARALEIAATISEETVKGVRQRMESSAPRERAKEPMRLILEKENNG